MAWVGWTTVGALALSWAGCGSSSSNGGAAGSGGKGGTGATGSGGSGATASGGSGAGGSGGSGGAVTPPAKTCAAAKGGSSGPVQKPTLRKTLAASWDENWLASPALVDITGDGKPDIIAARHSVLYAWKNDGTPLWHAAWASSASNSPDHGSSRMWASPVVGDFKGDGHNEIAVGSDADSKSGMNVAVYDDKGELLPGWPQHFGGADEVRSITAADVDGDGQLEILVNKTSKGPATAVYELDGTMHKNWPEVNASCNPAPPAEACWDFGGYNQNIGAGDLDGDGVSDVISTYDAIGFGVFKGDGTPFPTAPAFTDRVITAVEAYNDLKLSEQGWGDGSRSEFTDSPPVIADITNSGKHQIVLVGNHESTKSTTSQGKTVWVLNSDMTRPAGWISPKNTGTPLSHGSLGQNIVETEPSPSVADLDGKPGREIVVPASDGKMYAYRSDGTRAVDVHVLPHRHAVHRRERGADRRPERRRRTGGHLQHVLVRCAGQARHAGEPDHPRRRRQAARKGAALRPRQHGAAVGRRSGRRRQARAGRLAQGHAGRRQGRRADLGSARRQRTTACCGERGAATGCATGTCRSAPGRERGAPPAACYCRSYRGAMHEELGKALRESEDLYRSVFEAMTEGLFLQDASAAILAANEAAERLFGLTADQMMGRTSLDPRWRSIHEDGSPFPGETHPVPMALGTGEPQRDVIMGIHKPDGTLTWISINCQPLFREGESKPYAVLSTCTDITHKKLAEQALRESEERYRRIIDSTLEGVWTVDLDGNTTFANRRMAEIAGCTVEEFEKSNIRDFVDESDRPAVQERMAARARGVGEQHDFRLRRKDGTFVWTSMSAAPITFPDGSAGALAMVRDLTEERRMQEELKRSQEQLQQAQKLESIGRLAGGVAHDFNNLLTAILASVSFAEDAPPDLLKDELGTIRSAAERAAELTRQLLAFARRQVVQMVSLDLKQTDSGPGDDAAATSGRARGALAPAGPRALACAR